MASHRRTLAAAAATILASISLYPIFTGTMWFWAGCGSAAVVALAGTATRLRRLPVIVCLLAGAVALLLYLNVTFANAASLWHLLPTPGSLAALWDTAGQGFTEASKYAPPVPGLRGMVLLGAAGIGIAALLTDLIAVRLGSAALAGLPLLLLFTEPFTLSVQRGFVGTTLAFIASVVGYLWLLSSEARDRIREWEQPGVTARDEPDTRPLAAAGRRVGFASVALALCLPLFIPGLHMTRLFGGGHPGIGGKATSSSGSVGFPDPNLQLAQELTEPTPAPVLSYTYTGPAPDYLQIYTLDRLTADKGWQVAQQSLVKVSPRLPAAPGLTAPQSGPEQTEKISIARNVGQDQFGALPVPYPATTVHVGGHVQADVNTLMVVDPDVTLGGLQYSVTSRPPGATLAQLNAVPPVSTSDNARHYLSVPPSYQPLTATADSVVHAAGATTQYAEAIALQNWLSTGSFKYSLHAPTVLSAAALTKFLTVTKTGYCQQFSFAMAVMARLLGIPSRVAYGFTSGTPSSTSATSSTWSVKTSDAHAWPELYFSGYGWLRFEPTPNGPGNGQATAFAPLYASPQSTQGPGGALTSTPTTGASPTASAGGPGGRKQVGPNIAGFQAPGAGNGQLPGAGGAGTSPWAIAGLALAGLLVLAAAAPWCVRRAVRRRRWNRRRGTGRPGGPGSPGSPLGRADQVQSRDIAWAHAAWLELRDDLLDHGAGYRPSESPRAVAARAGERLSLADPAREALGRIALAEERARYAPAPADGARLRADSTAVRRAIAAAVPRGARWRARLLPASVLRATLSAATAAGQRYRALRGMSLPGDEGDSAQRPRRWRR
jgi:transglutaminase-like putative cysteine protease